MKTLSATIKITRSVPDNCTQEEFEKDCIMQLLKSSDADEHYLCSKHTE